MIKRALATFATILAVATPAAADPDVHTIQLPDGSTLTTVSDTNSQLWGPSTTQRVLVRCDPECDIVDSQISSFNFLTGWWNAVGEGVRRPTRVNNTTTTEVNNGSSSVSGADSASVAISESNANAEATNLQAQGQLQLQLQGQLQGQGQEQTASGGAGGSGGNDNGNCGNGPNGGGGNGGGNTCD